MPSSRARAFFWCQISHYDDVAAHCDCLSRINTILIDFCRDMWSYVSLNYFTQTIKKNEVGSSAMPHKVLPLTEDSPQPCPFHMQYRTCCLGSHLGARR